MIELSKATKRKTNYGFTINSCLHYSYDPYELPLYFDQQVLQQVNVYDVHKCNKLKQVECTRVLTQLTIKSKVSYNSVTK